MLKREVEQIMDDVTKEFPQMRSMSSFLNGQLKLPFPNITPPGPPTDHNIHVFFFVVGTELRVCLCAKTA